MYYRNAAVAVVVYDITRKDSFSHVAKHWVDELRKQVRLFRIHTRRAALWRHSSATAGPAGHCHRAGGQQE